TTDIPCMRLVKSMGGHSIAVYDPNVEGARDARRELIRENRVNFISPADYSEGTYLDTVVKAVSDKIVADDTLKNLINPEDK
ncbi:MAG: haloacid dehalogenase-like hydrolase, partial [Rikenellaceae bacterium]|nr:haloacid dehalogenase-like hydrolase [Rikenellaceae bacterium]